jgi:hypothetical protein
MIISINDKQIDASFCTTVEAVKHKFMEIMEFGTPVFRDQTAAFLTYNFVKKNNVIVAKEESAWPVTIQRISVLYAILGPVYEALGHKMPSPDEKILYRGIVSGQACHEDRPDGLTAFFEAFMNYNRRWGQMITELTKQLEEKDWSPVIIFAVTHAFLNAGGQPIMITASQEQGLN